MIDPILLSPLPDNHFTVPEHHSTRCTFSKLCQVIGMITILALGILLIMFGIFLTAFTSSPPTGIQIFSSLLMITGGAVLITLTISILARKCFLTPKDPEMTEDQFSSVIQGKQLQTQKLSLALEQAGKEKMSLEAKVAALSTKIRHMSKKWDAKLLKNAFTKDSKKHSLEQEIVQLKAENETLKDKLKKTSEKLQNEKDMNAANTATIAVYQKQLQEYERSTASLGMKLDEYAYHIQSLALSPQKTSKT